MLRLGTLLTRSSALAALCALAVVACGSQHVASRPADSAGASTSTPAARAPATGVKGSAAADTTKTLYIYSGLPHNGPQSGESRQIEQGIRFALAQVHHRVLGYQIRYKPLSDSTPQTAPRSRSGQRKKPKLLPSRGWNATATVRSAEQAARNADTVAYVGDLDSGATELSLPILNQAGIVQLTPGSGYPGLTDKVTGVTMTPGEPDIYYPQGRPSLFRLVPNDLVQADAIVSWLKGSKSNPTTCRTLSAAAFGTPKPSKEAIALVAAIEQAAKTYKLAYVSAAPGSDTKSYETYAHDLAATKGVDCFVLAGGVTRAAVDFTTEIKDQMPAGSVIVGTNGFCNPNWSDPARGGVSAAVGASLYCTTPVLPLNRYLNGTAFESAFQKGVHHRPTAYTYYGYLAGSLVLRAIRGIGGQDSREQVLANLVDNNASALLDTYTFDSDGDITGPGWNEYGLDKIDHGFPRHYKVLAP